MSGAQGTDGARPVRAGEELPLATLGPWLRDKLGLGERAAIEILQFPGGHSNLTYLITIDGKEYALRRPPFGSKVKTAHDMSREWRVLERLAPSWGKVPRPIAFCDDEQVIGAKFYLMERVRGTILRKQLPAGLTLDAPTCARLCDRFVSALVELHALDYQAIGLGDFGKPEGYVERQVSGWTQRYHGSRTDDIPEIEAVAKWLAEHRPESPAPTIVHNDFKFDNLILAEDDPTRIIAILDWEMATIGDPLMDLGTALCYWVEANDPKPVQDFRFGPTTLPGMMTRKEIAERYAKESGRDLSNVLFYYVFGLFKTAVVAQQIYYRYAQGLTKDERFAAMITGVRVLGRQATGALAKGGL